MGAFLIAGLAPAISSAWEPPAELPYREITQPTSGQPPMGAMLEIHGGAWAESIDQTIASRAEANSYAAQGWLVWNVDYRSGPDAYGDVDMWYRMLDDQVDVPICVSGWSSGGHLALLLAARQNPACTISEAGPTDLTTLPAVLQPYAAIAFGGALWENSPLRYARDDPASFDGTEILLGYAESDTIVPVAQARDFAAALPARTELRTMRPGGVSLFHTTVNAGDYATYLEAQRRLLTRVANPGSASVSDGTLSVTGADGAASVLRVDSTTPGMVTVRDPAGLRAGAGCTQIDLARVDCDASQISRADVAGGDRGDSLTSAGPLPVSLSGDAGADTLVSGSGPDVLSGGGDTDILDYGSRTAPLSLSVDGQANDGQAGEGDLIGGDIEYIYGGSGNDRMVGSAAPEGLFGQGGQDWMDGGLGADWLRGGPGSDVVDYGSRTAALNLSIDGTANDGQAGEADLIGWDFEYVLGGAGNDRMSGSGAPEALFGQGGQDTIDGGLGADWLKGGPGTDVVSYASRTVPLNLTLDGKVNDGQAGESDLIGDGFESVVGGSGDDRLVGSSAREYFFGQGGKDSMDGGLGADYLNGGPGSDLVDYSSRAVPLSLSIDDQPNDGQTGEGDLIVSNVEKLLGGQAADTIVGSQAADYLEGGSGDDVITGLGSTDQLLGGPGNDQITSRDLLIDDVDCAAGDDQLIGDLIDQLLGGCELLDLL